jgi:dTDP-4-amino-4,6-dideoxygalactose transaminase
MRSRLASHALKTNPGFGETFVSSTCMISAPDMNADQIEARLGAAGLGTRRWWRQGLHRIAEFADGAPGDLPVTRQIAQSYIGAPFYPDMPADTADRIVAALAPGTAA